MRFNGPAFKHLALLLSPKMAAMIAVLAGLAVAAWMRRRYEADEPAAWAWPMAVALAGAPVVYPWYLLYFTPFLFTRRALPLRRLDDQRAAGLHRVGARVPPRAPMASAGSRHVDRYGVVLTVLVVPAVLKRSPPSRPPGLSRPAPTSPPAVTPARAATLSR